MPDELGTRMKGYEIAFNYKHTARLPVILRFDGNSFSKFTKVTHLEKPFDERLMRAMVEACRAVLNYCSGAQVAYTQSDEISVLLRNDQNYETQPFLGARIQKLASLCTAVVSVAFDRAFRAEGFEHYPAPAFDCRIFILPPHEAQNYFRWRQLDCWKNCVAAFAHYKLGQKMGRKTAQKLLHGQGRADQIGLCLRHLGESPEDLPVKWRHGICVVRKEFEIDLATEMGAAKYNKLVELGRIDPEAPTVRKRWEHDFDTPWFIDEPDYIGDLLAPTTSG